MKKKQKTIVALMYDFDKTLCTKDMQEYTFIPIVGMTPDDFWSESTADRLLRPCASVVPLDTLIGCTGVFSGRGELAE